MVHRHVWGWISKRNWVAVGCWGKCGGGAATGAIPALGIAATEGMEQLQSKGRWALPGTNPCFLCFCGQRLQKVRMGWDKESFPLPPK